MRISPNTKASCKMTYLQGCCLNPGSHGGFPHEYSQKPYQRIKYLSVWETLCETQFSKSGLNPYIREWERHSLWKIEAFFFPQLPGQLQQFSPWPSILSQVRSGFGSHETRNHGRKMEAPTLKPHMSHLSVTLYIELHKNLVEGGKPFWVRISQISTWGFIIKVVTGS